jgi:biotin operon repressor
MDRAADERLLRLLHLRARGLSLSIIGRKMGMTKTAVQKSILRVRDADCAHDPEAAPWWRLQELETRR